MNESTLTQIARDLVSPGKGILAADESLGTIEKRFKTIGLESTPKTRRAYREMLFTAPAAEKYISGVIMFDETFRDQGGFWVKTLKAKGIIPGIKVDEGKKEFPGHPGEEITQGLAGLPERLKEYQALGAKFTKWRAVFTIGPQTPSLECLEENARLLAEFAALSQEADLMPIVEPEVLMDGDHSIDKTAEVTRTVLKMVFLKLTERKVSYPGLLLKPNMVLPGEKNPDKASPEKVAQRTLEVMKETVPSEVPGIVFLSGGQSEEEATANLREMNQIGSVPWQLSFSFGRALQNTALKTWGGKEENVKIAQAAFLLRAKMNSEACHGK